MWAGLFQFWLILVAKLSGIDVESLDRLNRKADYYGAIASNTLFGIKDT